jgi:hypothetical protein
MFETFNLKANRAADQADETVEGEVCGADRETLFEGVARQV